MNEVLAIALWLICVGALFWAAVAVSRRFDRQGGER